VHHKEHSFGKLASSGWGDVAVIIPWELYLLNGDTQFLQDNYAMIQRWIDFHALKADKYISSMRGFGDWLQPNEQNDITPKPLISTAYYASSLDYASKIATVLGKDDDAIRYTDTLNKVKHAFRKEFYDENTKVKSAATQTSYLLPLAFDILFKETYPSWFHSINNGATTTWERWNSYPLKDGFSKEKMNSLNHFAYGAVAKWFYEGILGINAANPGFKEINIEPQFNQRLDNASGSYKTPQGEVKVSWRISQGQLDMQVTKFCFIIHQSCL
jgi:alpha-L-rhamnosidase